MPCREAVGLVSWNGITGSQLLVRWPCRIAGSRGGLIESLARSILQPLVGRSHRLAAPASKAVRLVRQSRKRRLKLPCEADLQGTNLAASLPILWVTPKSLLKPSPRSPSASNLLKPRLMCQPLHKCVGLGIIVGNFTLQNGLFYSRFYLANHPRWGNPVGLHYQLP